MIKFFRKIRQKLLTENPSTGTGKAGKFNKYIFYAMGEILLVVIGILIALQINNWNENRKQKNLELSTLKEIKANLLADIKDFQDDLKVYNRAANSSEIIIDFIDGNLPYHDSLNIHFGKIPVLGVFTPNKAAYENLKITGIRLISNEMLRSAISDLYEGRYHYVENYMRTEYQFDHQKFGEFYLNEMEEYSFFKYAKPTDFKRLVGNQVFRNLIMHRKLKIQGWIKIQYELSMKKATQIIEMIDEEIIK